MNTIQRTFLALFALQACIFTPIHSQVYLTEEDILINESQIPMRSVEEWDGTIREEPDIRCQIWPDDEGHVTIPKEWTMIKSMAFYMCKPLKSVSFEDGSRLTRLALGAFASSGLQSIHLPPSLEFIEEVAFDTCAFLKNVTFSCPDPDPETADADADGGGKGKGKAKLRIHPGAFDMVNRKDGLDLSLPPGVRFFQESPGVTKTVRVVAPMKCGESASLSSVQKVEENLSAEEAAELEERELEEYMRSFGLERQEGPRPPAALDRPTDTCSGGKKKSNAELAAISARIAAKTVAARTRRREAAAAAAAAGGGGEVGAEAEGGLGQKREQEGQGQGQGKGKGKRGKRRGKEEEEEKMSPGEKAAIARAAERRKEMGITDDVGGHGGEL